MHLLIVIAKIITYTQHSIGSKTDNNNEKAKSKRNTETKSIFSPPTTQSNSILVGNITGTVCTSIISENGTASIKSTEQRT